MTDDLNKKHDQQPQSSRQTGQQGQEQTGQQKNKGTDNTAQKRPPQVGHDEDIDEQDEQDEVEKRRAS